MSTHIPKNFTHLLAILEFFLITQFFLIWVYPCKLRVGLVVVLFPPTPPFY